MRSILIPENEGDCRVLDRELMTGRALKPTGDGWTVVECHGYERRVEDFATLDGALLRATGLCGSEPRDKWDRDGKFTETLMGRLGNGSRTRLRGVETDPFSKGDPDDHDRLARLFAEAVVLNVNGCHSIRFLTEDHNTEGGATETDCIVEVTYSNECGPTVDTDGLLEAMNGLDWRNACDRIVTLLLERKGLKADDYDWPTPNARVTHAYDGEENDITRDVTVTFTVDRDTWEALVRGKPGTVTGETCNHCGGDLGELSDRAIAVVCPHCGKPSGVCCNCPRHDACVRSYRECPYERGLEEKQ